MAVPQRFVLRPHHHRIAFMLAAGKRVMDVCSELTVSPSRITELNKIPEFSEQVEAYKNQRDAIELDAFRQAQKLRASIHVEGLAHILQSIREEPEKWSKRDLIEIVGDCADRMGLSKVSRQESISMSVDLADSLAEARRRELKLVKPVVEDADPMDEGKD